MQCLIDYGRGIPQDFVTRSRNINDVIYYLRAEREFEILKLTSFITTNLIHFERKEIPRERSDQTSRCDRIEDLFDLNLLDWGWNRIGTPRPFSHFSSEVQRKRDRTRASHGPESPFCPCFHWTPKSSGNVSDESFLFYPLFLKNSVYYSANQQCGYGCEAPINNLFWN